MTDRNPDAHDAPAELFFSITDVAKQIGVVTATIRNWEKRGIIQPRRSQNGYRIFSLADIEHLKDIKRYSKDENMGIAAIKKFYTAQDRFSLEMDMPPSGEKNNTVSKKNISKKLKDSRVKRGLYLEDVARQVEISSSYLSKIENGQANVSYKTLEKLASFYGHNLVYYIGANQEEKYLTRKEELERTPINLEGVEVESLINLEKSAFLVMKYYIEPGCGRFISTTHIGEEFVHVLKGRISFRKGNETYILREGDSISFHSSEYHLWHNCGKATAIIMWIYSSFTQ